MQWTIARSVILGVIFLAIISLLLYSIAKKSEPKIGLYNLPQGVNLSIKKDFMIFAPLDVLWFGKNLNGNCDFSEFIFELPSPKHAVSLGDFAPIFFIPLVTTDWNSALPNIPAICENNLCYFDPSKEGGIFELKVSVNEELLEDYVKSKNPSFKLLDYNFSLLILFSKKGEYLSDLPYYEFSKDGKHCTLSGKILECRYEVKILKEDMNFPTEVEVGLKFNLTYQDIFGNNFSEIRELKPKLKFLIAYYVYNPRNFSEISWSDLKERYGKRMNSLLIYPCVVRKDLDFKGLLFLGSEGNFVNLSKCSTQKFSQASFNGQWFCKKGAKEYLLYSPFAVCRLGENGKPAKEPNILFLESLYSGDNKFEFRRAVYRELSLLESGEDVKETFCSAVCYVMLPFSEPCFSLCYEIYDTIYPFSCDTFCSLACWSIAIKDCAGYTVHDIIDKIGCIWDVIKGEADSLLECFPSFPVKCISYIENQTLCTQKCIDACNYINEINECR